MGTTELIFAAVLSAKRADTGYIQAWQNLILFVQFQQILFCIFKFLCIFNYFGGRKFSGGLGLGSGLGQWSCGGLPAVTTEVQVAPYMAEGSKTLWCKVQGRRLL